MNEPVATLALNKAVTLPLRTDPDIDLTAIRVGKHRVARKKTSKTSSLKSAIIESRNERTLTVAEPLLDGSTEMADDLAPSAAPIENILLETCVGQRVSDELDDLVFGLLKELSRLQSKRKDQPLEKQYKYKKFVVGFREVDRALKRKELKGVVISTNLELVPEMEISIKTIKDEADSQGVPVILSLSRRRMGKALGKSMKQSLVGIWSLEGIHQPWKQALSLLDSLKKTVGEVSNDF